MVISSKAQCDLLPSSLLAECAINAKDQRVAPPKVCKIPRQLCPDILRLYPFQLCVALGGAGVRLCTFLWATHTTEGLSLGAVLSTAPVSALPCYVGLCQPCNLCATPPCGMQIGGLTRTSMHALHADAVITHACGMERGRVGWGWTHKAWTLEQRGFCAGAMLEPQREVSHPTISLHIKEGSANKLFFSCQYLSFF